MNTKLIIKFYLEHLFSVRKLIETGLTIGSLEPPLSFEHELKYS